MMDLPVDVLCGTIVINRPCVESLWLFFSVQSVPNILFEIIFFELDCFTIIPVSYAGFFFNLVGFYYGTNNDEGIVLGFPRSA